MSLMQLNSPPVSPEKRLGPVSSVIFAPMEEKANLSPYGPPRKKGLFLCGTDTFDTWTLHDTDTGALVGVLDPDSVQPRETRNAVKQIIVERNGQLPLRAFVKSERYRDKRIGFMHKPTLSIDQDFDPSDDFVQRFNSLHVNVEKARSNFMRNRDADKMDVEYDSPIKRNQRTSIFPPTPGPSLFARPKVPKDYFPALLEQPWLVQTDVLSSISYLLKFYVSFEDLSCSLLITDGQSVWSETLSGNRLASRARACNSTGFAVGSSQSQLDQSHLENPHADEDEERLWLHKVLQKLAALYVEQSTFENIDFAMNESFNADWEVETSSSDISWRWDVVARPPKQSVDIISKHLILPLISLTGLAFSSPDPLSTLDITSESIKEKGNPLVSCFSSPRAVTAVRRVTQMIKYSNEPEPILSSFGPNAGSEASGSQSTTAYSASRETTVRPRTISTTPTRDLPSSNRPSASRKSVTPRTKRTRADVYAEEIKENIYPKSPGNATASEGEKSTKAPVSAQGGGKRRMLVRRAKQ
ncbi:hypothetical protein BOTBODRAFT_39075 [Botryobasidium botryosum FD-172 SS1]|uniref:XLF-like N-terminal domain-containing protein n=1 Tax=Botryobasidium botryosum (strain FD-172 SS1) TaxID=930990 RepID=A0A067M5D2_BOTB1|nr:hypothetical protein BOTBODRAFT_39075 [Botryobasidium botryosum FD-172 SS1]